MTDETIAWSRANLPDGRYTVTREHAGYAAPVWVVRFCGEWVSGGHFHEASAVRAAHEHHATRTGSVIMDHEELGRFLARYTPEEWRLWTTGACAMTQSSNAFDPDRLCRDDRVPGYVHCQYHLDDMRDNYRRTDADLRIPPSVTEWLSY